MNLIWILSIILIFILLGALVYWLVVITEGVYLGRRAVVWMYDLTAHKYDNIKQFEEEAERLFVVRPFLKHLPAHPAPLILDVAAGTGRVPYFLLEEPSFNGRVVALEPSRKMLAVAVPKLRPFHQRAALVAGTAVPLPFPANTFHGVTCLEALEFFPSDEAALREMARVLRPGGSLMVTRRRGWEAQTFVGRYRDTEQFEALLADLGFSDVKTLPWQVDYDQVFARKG
ncbi:MAG: class I SAM-dependent methyltransferase [Anaerolineales bacterium]|nr:class I SAM-dependent methyltransferase [Anaerolineales bacterium]